MSRRVNLETRARILEAAHELFYRKGFGGVSMDAVAAEAGLKKANLFHYYPSREALELAVFDRAAAGMREDVVARFSGRKRDPVGVVARIFDDAARRMRERECRGGCFVGNIAQEISDQNEKVRVKVSEFLRFWTDQLASFLEGWRRSGYFRSQLKPRPAAEAILALFEGAMLYSKASREPRPVESAKRLAVGYLRAFRA